MHPIGDDTETCTPEKEFTEGNPATAALATPVKAPWLNTVQRELIAILTAAAIVPATDDDDQVLEALQLLFAALGHGHAIADVTGLQAALDARSLVGHLHTIANVTGLQAALDAKSDVGHLHDAIYAASLAVAAGQLLLKSRSGATLSTVDLSPLPPGAICGFAMASPPAGWLVCDGSAVSRVTYAALFAAIGTVWGVGNGSTTFNLPQANDRYRRGASPTYPVGTLLDQQLLAHDHQTRLFSDGKPLAEPSGTGAAASPSYSYNYVEHSGNIIMTSASGGAENRPRTLVELVCIKF